MKLFVNEVDKGVEIVWMGVKAGFLLSQQLVDPPSQRTPFAVREPLAH
jgi:hypothetical protein